MIIMKIMITIMIISLYIIIYIIYDTYIYIYMYTLLRPLGEHSWFALPFIGELVHFAGIVDGTRHNCDLLMRSDQINTFINCNIHNYTY